MLRINNYKMVNKKVVKKDKTNLIKYNNEIFKEIFYYDMDYKEIKGKNMLDFGYSDAPDQNGLVTSEIIKELRNNIIKYDKNNKNVKSGWVAFKINGKI